MIEDFGVWLVIEDCPSPEITSSPQIDTTVAQSARVWDYWLDGKDHYPVDRQVGGRIAEIVPGILTQARANRMFLGRAVRFLAGEVGIGQFLDIGAGLPAVDNTHEVAQRVAPECRVVYVDNDPLALLHAKARLASSPGGTDYLLADLRDPGDILAGAARTLDLTKPVGILMLGVVWHVLDDGQARAVIDRLMGAVPSGSHLAITHPTLEVAETAIAAAIAYWNGHGVPPGRLRSLEQIAGLLDGLELVEPGLVSAPLWRPEAMPFGELEPIDLVCAVARKP